MLLTLHNIHVLYVLQLTCNRDVPYVLHLFTLGSGSTSVKYCIMCAGLVVARYSTPPNLGSAC